MMNLTKQMVIEELKKQLPFLNKEFGVIKIGLFGSFAKEMQTEKSDVDLILEFEKPVGIKIVRLGDYLENLFARKVDLLTPGSLKSIPFQELKEEIEREVEYV